MAKTGICPAQREQMAFVKAAPDVQNALAHLLELGLSRYESQIYLALVQEGSSTAKALSGITSVPYGKVYEVMDCLAEKGMATVLPTKPMQCQAVRPSQAVAAFRSSAESKFNRLEQAMVALEQHEPAAQDRHAVHILRGRAHVNRKIDQLLRQATTSVSILATENALRRLVAHKEALLDAAGRGVKLSGVAMVTAANQEDAESLACCAWNRARVSDFCITVDGEQCMLIDAIPDDDNITYGRDMALLIARKSWTRLLDKAIQAMTTIPGRGK